MKTNSKFNLLVFLISLASFSEAQVPTRSCSYYGDKTVSPEELCASLGYSNNAEAEAAIDRILEQVGIFSRNFGVLECAGIENCMAYRQGELQYIIYDTEFLEKFRGLGFKNTDLTENWASLSIMAHEIGHLVHSHLIVTKISNHKHELEADAFSGFVLAKLGASLSQAQGTMQSHLLPDKGTYTHPPRAERLEAIHEGWLKGGGLQIEDDGKNNSVIKELHEASRFYVSENYTEAFKLFYKHRFDKLFDDVHQKNLGNIYMYGIGVPQDYSKARYWYEKSIDSENTNAMNNLGLIYREGLGVSKDFEKSLYWIQKAVKGNNFTAMSNLAQMYADGLGVPKDYEKAIYWYEKAIEGGNVKAMLLLGRMYEDSLSGLQDYVKAKYWYEKAIEKGNTTAMVLLGIMYLDGLGVQIDSDRAMYWFEKSSELDEPMGMLMLAYMYYDGDLVLKDHTKAKYWLEKSSNNGNEAAMYLLGTMYEKGYGLTVDKEKAVYWYQKSAKLGYADAKTKLKDMKRLVKKYQRKN